jgi:hypothetical protein
MPNSPQKVLPLTEPPSPHQQYTQGVAEAMGTTADISLSDLRDVTQCILMDGLVRKVTPQFFASVLADVVAFLTNLARLEAAVHAKNALLQEDPDRKPAVLEGAILKLMVEINKLRSDLAEKTMRMSLCRDEGTPLS